MTKRIALAAASLSLAALAGCDNGKLTELNRNPNSPESVPPGPVFTNATQNAVARWLGATRDLRQMSTLAQHVAENQYPDADRYSGIRAAGTQADFNASYVSELEDFRVVNRLGTNAKQPGTSAPATIMQQWEFDYLTGSYGSVPYSDALAGDSTGGSVSPKYDAQKDVYAGMLQRLASASSNLTGASNTLGGADPIYAGNVAKWQRFANSLRARIAIQLVNADPAKADAELKAAFTAAGGTFTSNADMALLNWPGDGLFNNPWSDNFKSRDDFRMSKTLMDFLTGYSDPRTAVYAQPAAADPTGKTYAGQPNGLLASAAGAYTKTASRPGAIFYPGVTTYGTFGGNGAKQPSYLMTYAELAFIRAEAAERGLGGLTPGQAAGFYNAAITASMTQWGTTDASKIAAYLAQPSVAYQGGTAGLKQIATQKWIALYTDGTQAWFEWRRTCQPATIKPGPAAIVNYVPRRIEYPTTETSTNSENLTAAVKAQGGSDAMNNRLYIDPANVAPTCQ